MNPVRAALYSRLSGDATLTALLSTTTSIYHQRAPQTAQSPYIVFFKQAGNPRRTFAARYDGELWAVKAVDKASSANRAEDIAARIDVLLDNHPLVITGRVTMSLQRESDIDFPEDDGADTWRHAGASYRLNSQPS